MTPGREPLRDVTDSEIRAFTDDGVVHLTGILPEGWIDLLDGPVDETIADPSVTANLTVLGEDLAADLGSEPLIDPRTSGGHFLSAVSYTHLTLPTKA